jgi:hypothetical protein
LLSSEGGRRLGWPSGPLGPSGVRSQVGQGGVGFGRPAGQGLRRGRARGGWAGREGQAGWAERAKREEVFGLDFK